VAPEIALAKSIPPNKACLLGCWMRNGYDLSYRFIASFARRHQKTILCP